MSEIKILITGHHLKNVINFEVKLKNYSPPESSSQSWAYRNPTLEIKENILQNANPATNCASHPDPAINIKLLKIHPKNE